MKIVKLGFVLVAAVVVVLGLGSTSFAFHSGGVAECEGCHSMHNSFEGSANVTGMPQFQSGPYLLKAQEQSGACLNCHQQPDTAGSSYHISTAGVVAYDSTAPVEQTPGGDFAWLKKTMTGSIRKTATTWEGDRHGHNIISTDYGFTQDKVQTVAPGGSYPAANLACSSCHDPHGKYRRDAAGNVATTGLPIFNSGSYTSSANPISGVSAVGVYRLLAGVGYQPKSLTGSFAFTNASPDAVAPSTFNGNGNAGGNTIAGTWDRVGYGQGMSEWCANCHTQLLRGSYTSGMKGLTHPAGNGAKLTAAIAANYNAYVKSGDLSGTLGYSSLAPYETGMTDRTPASYTALKAFQAAPTAAATTNNVACVSCHRAHATGFESMTRFYTGNEFMTVADSTNASIYDTSTTENKINTAYNTTQQTLAYQGRSATLFSPYNRDYCNKCHAKD